jgi:hypothetical protein
VLLKDENERKIDENTITKTKILKKEKYLFFTLSLKSRELITTETLLKAIASHASSGFKNNQKLINTQAAMGIHKLL